jgi:hypothetical protein
VEGIREAPDTQNLVRAMIVDESFPWWWTPLLSVDINVIKVWLSQSPCVDSNYLSSTWCRGVPVIVGKSAMEEAWEAVQSVDWLIVGGKIPYALLDKGLWNVKGLKVVVYTGRSKELPPKPWTQTQYKLHHCQTGGVTDGWFEVTIATVLPGLSAVSATSIQEIIYQDLRWVMKSSVEGTPSPVPGLAGQKEAAGCVIYCGKNIIQQAGLLPYARQNVKVRSEFRGRYWVDRLLTMGEKLLVMDVPERLVLEVREVVMQERLLGSIQVPGKVLQFVAGQLAHQFRLAVFSALGMFKRKRAALDIVQPNKRMRSECSEQWPALTQNHRPEKERLLETEVAEQLINMEAHNLKAIKNDNSEVVIALWNEYLLLDRGFKSQRTTKDSWRQHVGHVKDY